MANNGNIKIIREGDGGIIIDRKTGAEMEFKQPYHKALFLKEGDNVRYEVYSPKGAKASMAIYVERVTVGVISEVSGEDSGTITLKGGKDTIPFYQPFLKELRLAIGDNVRFDLVAGLKEGTEMAINVREIDN